MLAAHSARSVPLDEHRAREKKECLPSALTTTPMDSFYSIPTIHSKLFIVLLLLPSSELEADAIEAGAYSIRTSMRSHRDSFALKIPIAGT